MVLIYVNLKNSNYFKLLKMHTHGSYLCYVPFIFSETCFLRENSKTGMLPKRSLEFYIYWNLFNLRLASSWNFLFVSLQT